jgi:vitamin B12 transporter
MLMMKRFLALLILLHCVFSPTAKAITREEELAILSMYYSDEDLVIISSTRSEKYLSKVAENVTVVTAEEIKAMNAHTLTDVLYHVPGISLDLRGGPGAVSMAYIQGSPDVRHLLVVVDGVAMNEIGGFGTNTGGIPVKNIERIEIIKGPASSAWGSSLGGVINIITKGNNPKEKFKGNISASYGEADTTDSYAEATGKLDNMKYYVNYNKLRTNGLTANTPHDADHFYSKLKWDLSDRVDLLFTLGYMEGDTGEGEIPEYDVFYHNYYTQIFTTMGLGVKLWEGADFNLSVKGKQQDGDYVSFQKSAGTEGYRSSIKETDYGVSGKFSWKKGANQMVAGLDYDHGQLESNSFTSGNTHLLKRWAGFANDTITWRDFTLVPGFRYDHASPSGGFLSPSIGLTYKPWQRFLLRSYVARGFSLPGLIDTFGTGVYFVSNPDLKMEKVWSYQVGAETTAVPYLWLKTSLFRNNISDGLAHKTLSDTSSGTKFTIVNQSKQRRQGFEAEAKTIPLFHTSLNAGFVLTDVKDLDTGTYLETSARYTVDVGAQYDHPDIIQATLKGHYILWNPYKSVPIKHNFDSFIWDLHLSKEVYHGEWGRTELFLSGRNLLNSSQYLIEYWKNPGRWVEGGVRLEF